MIEQTAIQSNKNTFILPLRKDGPLITVSSQFDSGNMIKA